MDSSSQQACNENALLRKQIELLEKQNNMLEAKVNELSSQMNRILESTPSMEDIKKWTCEYVERELDDIHPLKDRWECTGYLPEYDGCVGYFYHKPRTTIEESRKNAQIHYNRSEVMKQPEIQLSD